MRKLSVTLAALAATAALAWSFFGAMKPANEPSSDQPLLVRVWLSDQEAAVWTWLRKEAKRFEQETGMRVYLRAAPANSGMEFGEGFPPDLLISGSGGRVVAMQGYAIFYRDDAALAVTPCPTSLLFFQPTLTPGPSLTPAPTPDAARFSALLAPSQFISTVPAGIRSANPVQDLIDGKGDAAILTVEQASRLPFSAGMCPLPDGKGFLPVCCAASTPGGEAFLSYLCTEPPQRALAASGLFSPLYPLYRQSDIQRELIEQTLSFPAADHQNHPIPSVN